MTVQIYNMQPIDPNNYWDAVTDVTCPVEGCDQTVVWYEAGYVPGYRVCMKCIGINDTGYKVFDMDSVRHHFISKGNSEAPTLELLND